MLSYTFNVTPLPANTLARTTVPAALVDPAAGHPTLQRAGQHAVFATDEFFSACVVNPHTRRAYSRAVRRFLDWCELQNIDLAMVTPGAAGRFIEELPGSAAAKNQARAALKQFGDRLVQRHVIALNPFATVRSQKHQTDGKTPEITVPQARRLLASIDVATVVGLRDRAVIGTLSLHGGARRRPGATPQPRPARPRNPTRPSVPREERQGPGNPRATRPRTVAPRLPGRRRDSSFVRRNRCSSPPSPAGRGAKTTGRCPAGPSAPSRSAEC